MEKTNWHHILLLAALILCAENSYSIPAPRRVTTITQPDGSVLKVYRKGDEFFHYTTSTDGYVLLRNKENFYTYAVKDSSGELQAGNTVAVNEEKRSSSDKQFLKTIQPGLSASGKAISTAISKRLQKISARKAASVGTSKLAAGLINDYPTTGNPKSLVILVNFSDVKFNAANTTAEFSSLLNEEGYNKNGHVGSARDYYKYNSKNVFTPDFVVVGPVTVSKTRNYYGQNDASGEDLYPEEMVKEACILADATVDFSQYDYNKDGYVDNIYFFYAGMGEADSGLESTIWPHSSSLENGNITLTLDGMKINKYACSNELNYNNERTGIGTFVHEYAHILGLPDLYDVDYDSYNGQGFDLGSWSLMAYGPYNNNSCVPPCMSVLERKLLGWGTPTELTLPESLSLPDFGSSNQGYIIKTSNDGEYFLLENRQLTKNPWDAYLPYHGMLIYHIDLRSDATINADYWGQGTFKFTFAELWEYNLVNAISTHQCADLEEADNTRIFYSSSWDKYLASLEGDPFPGTSNVRTFADGTTPSMKTWNGVSLNKPISSIKESNQEISFDFMGGSSFTSSPESLPATEIKPFQFTANWKPVTGATSYYLDVYTQNVVSGDTVRSYISGFQDINVKDTTTIVTVPNDLTSYYYKVRATNDYSVSPSSKAVTLKTADGTPVALTAADVNPFKFTANWENQDWAESYYLDVYQLSATKDTIFIYGYHNAHLTVNEVTINELEDQSTYYYRVRSTTGASTTRYSSAISVTTPRSPVILPYVKNKTIYLKGMDPGCEVKIYDSVGLLLYTANKNEITVKNSGVYFIETYYEGKRKTIKLQVY